MLQIQMGKAKELFSPWGVRPKELTNLVETGVVKTLQAGRGKGSLRLLDEKSIFDVFIAHSLGTLGLPRRRIADLIVHIRPHYREWISEEERIVVFEFKTIKKYWPISPSSILIDLAQVQSLIKTCLSSREGIESIHRGRPAGDWRKQFRAVAKSIAKEMNEKGITEEDIDTAIAEVRERRKTRAGKDVTTVVTVPAS
jgi:hypothetical protein